VRRVAEREPILIAGAGALGSVAGGSLSAQELRGAIREVRGATDRPFAVNVFAPPFLRDGALDVVLEERPPVCSFTFGVVDPRPLHEAGIVVLGTATTVEEAQALERAGVDAIVAQGAEAGGHRGSFLADFDSSLIGTMALVPQIVDAVRVPVIAAGGIADAKGVAAAMALGASAVQVGTAYLLAPEATTTKVHRAALKSEAARQTQITHVFSGRPARGIVNRFMREVEPASALPFPLQNALTRPLRAAAAKQGRAEFLSLWAGQGVRMARRMKASDLVAALTRETEAAIVRLQRSSNDLKT